MRDECQTDQSAISCIYMYRGSARCFLRQAGIVHLVTRDTAQKYFKFKQNESCLKSPWALIRAGTEEYWSSKFRCWKSEITRKFWKYSGSQAWRQGHYCCGFDLSLRIWTQALSNGTAHQTIVSNIPSSLSSLDSSVILLNFTRPTLSPTQGLQTGLATASACSHPAKLTSDRDTNLPCPVLSLLLHL